MGCMRCVMAVLAMPVAWAAGDEADSGRARGDERAGAGDHAEAVEVYRRAVAADPDDLEAHDRLAKHRIALGALAETIEQLEPVVRRHPSYARGIYTLAYCYRKLNRPKDAITSYDAYIRLRPDDPDPHYGRGQALRQAGRTDEALGAFRTYVGMETRSSASAWVERARAAIRELESAGAAPASEQDELERQRTEVRDRPTDPAAWKALAAILRARGLEKEAASAERRAAQAEQSAAMGVSDELMAMPEDLSAGNVRVVGVAPATGNGRVEQLRTAVRDDPVDADSWFLLAQALSKAGRRPEAEWAKRRHQELREGGPGPGSDPIKTAEETIEVLETELRQHARKLMGQGDRMFQAKRFADAKEAYREAAEADPTSAEAEYRRGLAALELGRKEEARRAFERALDKDPSHAGAPARLQELAPP